jgi:MSHA biogenesis protein MshJ
VNLQGIKNRSEQMIVGINASKYDIRVLEERSKKDVSLPYRNKLQSLKQKSDEQQNKINSITSALIQPEKMNLVFKGLLEKSNLRFDSIKNLKPKVIELNQSKDSNQVLYEHGLVIEMRGSYLDGLAYIKSIENQSWQLYWDEVEYKTTRYPQGELTLKVHTISTSKKVLGL